MLRTLKRFPGELQEVEAFCGHLRHFFPWFWDILRKFLNYLGGKVGKGSYTVEHHSKVFFLEEKLSACCRFCEQIFIFATGMLWCKHCEWKKIFSLRVKAKECAAGRNKICYQVNYRILSHFPGGGMFAAEHLIVLQKQSFLLKNTSLFPKSTLVPRAFSIALSIGWVSIGSRGLLLARRVFGNGLKNSRDKNRN